MDEEIAMLEGTLLNAVTSNIADQISSKSFDAIMEDEVSPVHNKENTTENSRLIMQDLQDSSKLDP